MNEIEIYRVKRNQPIPSLQLSKRDAPFMLPCFELWLSNSKLNEIESLVKSTNPQKRGSQSSL